MNLPPPADMTASSPPSSDIEKSKSGRSISLPAICYHLSHYLAACTSEIVAAVSLGEREVGHVRDEAGRQREVSCCSARVLCSHFTFALFQAGWTSWSLAHEP